MDKRLIAGIGALAILAAGGWFFLGRGESGPRPGEFTFETAAIEKGDVARIVSASGDVQPLNMVEVGSEVSGKIIELFADFNTPVKKDQVLAQSDPETFRTAVEQARARQLQSEAAVASADAAIERSKVNLDTAEKTYNRQKALFAEQAISQAAWEQAERDYKNARLDLRNNEVALQSAKAGLAQSRASLEESQTRLDRTKIRSPIDGVVINRAVNVGQTVQSSMNVARFFTIAQDLSQIQIEAAVVESDIGGIDIGDPVSFTVDAFPGERFQGSVQQVRQQGVEQANVVTYTVVISARNPNGRLLPGMTANVEITADRATDVLRISYDATRFNPPKELAPPEEEAQVAGGPPGMGGGGPPGGFGGGGGPPGAGGRGPQAAMGEWLKEAGGDEARIEKVNAEMSAEFEKLRSTLPMFQQGQRGGGGAALAGGGGPPASMQMQQQMQEFRTRIQAAQDGVLKRNLSADEIARVQAARARMQTQRRVQVYALDAEGKLERKQLTIGVSDGDFAEVIRGAEVGDLFVVKAVPGGTKSARPAPRS
jgi:HlyD family secretion protein